VNIAMTDRELLDQLSRDRSEAAFTELVRRHIDLVHSAALRQLGDADTARHITQQVFLLLAREAGRLPAAVILSGWLYRTTRHLCLETLRRDRRRRERERTAAAQLMNDATANPWEQVAPALEPAMDELGETDRQAILLRYFENRSLREVGAALGLGEDAAQKRVSRALDRLREIFSRRGVSLSATALAGSLSAGAVQAAPAGLAVTISTAALGGAAVATATTLATKGASTAMNLINLKTAAAILGAAAVTGTATYVVQEREAEQLRTENTALNQTHAKLASDQQQALTMIQLRDEQIAVLKKGMEDLPRLRGEVDGLRRAAQMFFCKFLEHQTEGGVWFSMLR
jgi:RNA polymerase sigma factor (sigma-70 family)